MCMWIIFAGTLRNKCCEIQFRFKLENVEGSLSDDVGRLVGVHYLAAVRRAFVDCTRTVIYDHYYLI